MQFSSEIIGLLILSGCVLFFVTRWLPEAVTGVIGCLLMVLFRVCSFEDAFSEFSNSIVILMVSAMIVGVAMFKTGAAQMLGRAAIKMARGNEKRFLMVTFLLASVLSMFLANTAILAALIPIVDSVCRASTHMKRMNLMLPFGCAVMFGGSCTLIGCTPQLTADSLLLEMSGEQMTMWTLTGPGVCLLVLFTIYLFFYGYKDGVRIWGDRPEAEMHVEQSKLDAIIHTKIDRKKFITMMIIVVLMLFSYITSFLPTAVTALCAAILCVVTGCCSMKDVAREIQWDSVIFLGSCLGLGNALTIAGTGDFIGRTVGAMLGSVDNAFVIFSALVALSMLLSQFITNSTAIIIVLPIGISLCTAYGFNTMAFTVGITLAASLAFCTPLAAAQITMTRIAGYKFTDYAKFGWKPSLLILAGILIFVPLFLPLV